ncbi:MAG: response regulator [Syntrophales bacterium]|jgi:CheY-like chemotaxis protein|nr:response regulator [Syntrophales bacterium]MCK9527644.1 response regulator [Syntrophales bacterium]MDX9922261.1 response regulator [Syntrophales bacterium]
MSEKVRKVLVVDDEEDFCSLTKQAIKAMTNFKVMTATDGRKAVSLAKKENPDVILLDIMMPGMSGSVVAEELLENPRTASIPIIFVTAIVKDSEIKDSDGMLGNRMFIAKPINVNNLLEKMHMVLGLPHVPKETSDEDGWFLT